MIYAGAHTNSSELLTYLYIMIAVSAIRSKYYRLRGRYGKRRRLLFTSPAEVEFVRIMGGWAITIDLIKDVQTGFPLTIMSLGKLLKSENMEREVRVGRYYADFGNDVMRAIEVDGKRWHNDVVKEMERDEYFHSYGWLVIHIKAIDIYRNPDIVRDAVTRFLTK